mgnify:CR=1 FL=1
MAGTNQTHRAGAMPEMQKSILEAGTQKRKTSIANEVRIRKENG